MHGEYRAPGGQLVAADVEVADGRLARVTISGDFFPGPDDAMERIDAAVTGLPVTADTAAITARVEAALGGEVMLARFSAETVAVAVRRALTRASGWRDHDWRLVYEEPQDPALHMALDEVLAREVDTGRRPPTLRIWEWAAPAVIIGSFQSLRNEVDAEQARELGITVVRRISGGGAMLAEPGKTITYSLYAPGSLVAGMSYAESYAYLDDWVIGALTGDLGLNVWYRPLNDIASTQGKIGGAAQKRLAGGTVLHHVTMAYDMDPAVMMRVLRSGGRSCQARESRARPNASTRCAGRPGCPGPRSSTRSSAISAATTDSPAAASPPASCAPRPNWPGQSSPLASGPPGCRSPSRPGQQHP